MSQKVSIGGVQIGGDAPLALLAGPCVIEDRDITLKTAEALRSICDALGMGFVFKSSYDKANRTSVSSYRGPGPDEGIAILSEVREKAGVPVITDVHTPIEASAAAEALDAIQIPAFLCRQTDLIVAAGKTGKPVNVKKGQFMAPWDMKYVVEKFRSTGNDDLLLTERGTSFGYNNLIVDFRGLPVMRAYGCPVVFDVTHSLQLPGGMGGRSGGQREFAGPLMRAAVAVGVDALFIEVHPNPEAALCDGPNMLPLAGVEKFLQEAMRLSER